MIEMTVTETDQGITLSWETSDQRIGPVTLPLALAGELAERIDAIIAQRLPAWDASARTYAIDARLLGF